MQTHTLNSRPSGRYSGNVETAIREIWNKTFAKTICETADGLLVVGPRRGSEYGKTNDADNWCDCMTVFPIVAGRVDLAAVAAFIGH